MFAGVETGFTAFADHLLACLKFFLSIGVNFAKILAKECVRWV